MSDMLNAVLEEKCRRIYSYNRGVPRLFELSDGGDKLLTAIEITLKFAETRGFPAARPFVFVIVSQQQRGLVIFKMFIG